MKIPISVYTQDDSILIYRNGGVEKIDFPFKPFVLVQKDKFTELLGEIEIWHKVPEDEDREYLRIEFNTISESRDFKKRFSNKLSHILQNIYNEQMYISKEDLLLNYPHTNELKVMFWDIEVASKGDGLFPKALTNEILAIGYSIWVYDNNGEKRKICQNICKGFDSNTMCDKFVIDSFLDAVQEHDPDILAGFNTNEFDLPYLIERAQIVKSNLKKLCRGEKDPVIDAIDNTKIRIPGRIQFDIYNSNSGVAKDQSLFGIKSKTLKDLARWYKVKRTKLVNSIWVTDKMEDIEVKEHIENLLNLFKEDPELLYTYLDDDIYRTEGVGHVYLRNCITLAEMMKVPLDSIINMYSSFVPKLLIARNMEKLRLINTQSNFNRYNVNTGTIAKIGIKYEGAIVGLYKDGYQPSTWKLDFASMYPSSIQTFNLGPDTTTLVRVEEYTGKYNCIVEGNYNWYRVPTYFEDGKYKYDLIVKVRNDKEGFLKQNITKFKAERKIIKTEMKTADEDKYLSLYSQQLAIKIIMNSLYGFFALKTSSYGDIICAVMVTSLCRWCSLKFMQRNEKYLVETDSVTGNTPIYVYNTETKEIDIIPIEDLHQSEIKRKKYTDKYLIYTRNGWKNINYTKKHQVNKNIHRVKISDGYVDITRDHSLFTTDKKEISPKDLIVNKSLIETINNNPIQEKLIYGATVSNKDFCWLIGFFIAEGSVYEGYTKTGKAKRQVSFNGNNLDLMQKVEKLANEHFRYLKLFGLPNKPHKFKLHNTLKSSAVYKVQGGYNKDICDFLKEYCYTKNRKEKKVPTFILNGTDEMKQSFIDGLFDGDGHIATHKKRKVESIDSKFKSLAAGIRFILNSLGYPTTCSIDSKFKSLIAGIRFILNSLGYPTTCSIRKDKLNITTYKKRIKRNKFKEIDRNIITQNNIISEQEIVYDVSTEDGTFITALGNIVLHNTDGFITNKKLNPVEETTWLDKEIKDKFHITDNHMQLELEGDGEAAYFYMMKNYIKLTHDNKYEIHGSSFKTSRSAKIVDRAIKLGLEYIFNNKPIEEVLNEAYNFKGLQLSDFIERIKMSKNPREYDDQFDWRIFLSKQVEAKTGQIITEGTQMNYVITKNSLPQAEFRPYYRSGKNYTYIGFVNSIDELDFNTYNDMIDKALSKFGISKKKFQQTSLFQNEKKTPIKNKKLDVIQKEL